MLHCPLPSVANAGRGGTGWGGGKDEEEECRGEKSYKIVDMSGDEKGGAGDMQRGGRQERHGEAGERGEAKGGDEKGRVGGMPGDTRGGEAVDTARGECFDHPSDSDESVDMRQAIALSLSAQPAAATAAAAAANSGGEESAEPLAVKGKPPVVKDEASSLRDVCDDDDKIEGVTVGVGDGDAMEEACVVVNLDDEMDTVDHGDAMKVSAGADDGKDVEEVSLVMAEPARHGIFNQLFDDVHGGGGFDDQSHLAPSLMNDKPVGEKLVRRPLVVEEDEADVMAESDEMEGMEDVLIDRPADRKGDIDDEELGVVSSGGSGGRGGDGGGLAAKAAGSAAAAAVGEGAAAQGQAEEGWGGSGAFLFSFPAGAADCVSVTVGDVGTLDEGTFLNDTVGDRCFSVCVCVSFGCVSLDPDRERSGGREAGKEGAGCLLSTV